MMTKRRKHQSIIVKEHWNHFVFIKIFATKYAKYFFHNYLQGCHQPKDKYLWLGKVLVCCLRLIKMFVGNKPLVITNCRKSIYHLCANFYNQILSNFAHMEKDQSYFCHVQVRMKKIHFSISNQVFLSVSKEVASKRFIVYYTKCGPFPISYSYYYIVQ